MYSRLILWPLILMSSIIFNSCSKTIPSKNINIIPLPNKIERTDDSFVLSKSTKIVFDKNNTNLSGIVNSINAFTKLSMGTIDPASNSIKTNYIELIIDDKLENLGLEGYQLSIDPDRILIGAFSEVGLFRAAQSLRQLISAEIENGESNGDAWEIPGVNIEDRPRFEWRGMMMDCARHFMTKEWVKRYIDLLAYYKFNKFHWHLTEDQGWRIEIEKYPRLTEISAWRINSDSSLYGGYYSKEDIIEVVEYAASKYIEVIPEIEMPGHSLAALAAYPELSCTGGPFKVTHNWGVFEDVYCAGNEKVYEFNQNILDEVIELFPSGYIHIGGDEVPKERWKKCKKCQRKIKNEKLKNEVELQAYFVKRINDYISSKGKIMIGWDEILEGGGSDESIIQSWRGFEGAIEAAHTGRKAIVSPTSHAYLDYDVKTTSLRKVYSFDPVPKELTEEESKYIIGGEANIWSERAPQDTMDSKVFPRILGMAEALWTEKENKSFEDFGIRLQDHYKRLNYKGVNYGSSGVAVVIDVDFSPEKKEFTLDFLPAEPIYNIHYTFDGVTPSIKSAKFSDPIVFNTTKEIRAQAFRNGKPVGKEAKTVVSAHLAVGMIPKLKHPYHNRYTGGGELGLTDGLRASNSFRDGMWQAFFGKDMEAVFEFDKYTEITKVTVGTLHTQNAWIFIPKYIEIFVSEDGTNYTAVKRTESITDSKSTDHIIEDIVVKDLQLKTKYLKVLVKNFGETPEWHIGAGDESWLFIDEIIVE